MVLKTSFISAAVVALSSLSLSAFAHPFGHSHSHHSGHTHKRQFAGAINQCLHDFAVTFDDGPHLYTQDVITAFNDRSSKTTFYVNGDNWGCIYTKANYDAVVNAYNSGHQIASHTWSHRDIALLSNEELDFEIQKLDEALVRILGVKPRFVRPPFGSIKPEQVTYLQTVHNKIVVGWDLDSKDTVAAASGGANTVEKVFNFYDDLAAQVVTAGVCPPAPHFTLAHDVQQHSVLATPDALDALLEVGYKLVTTAECMDEDPYVYVGEPQPWSETWTCQKPPTSCPDLEYSSREGDTCTSISAKYQMATSAFQTANAGLTCATSSVQALEAGTPVCVSKPTCPSDYALFSTINTDTCESLQTLHDILQDEFAAANPSVDCAALQVGTYVCLPPLPQGTCSGQQVPYTVVSGDFCFKIADAHGMTVEELLASNPTLVCENLQIGVQLCVDPITPENPEDPEDPEDPEEPSTCSVTHAVVSGEYCYLIATKNNLTLEEFLALNPGLNCAVLQIGQQVCVKAGTTPEGPVDPQDPQEPVDPEVPEEPVDPEDPEEPVDPEVPEEPVDPEVPEEPVDPEDPEEPVDPEDPEEPVDPEEPEAPVCAWTYTSKADDTCSSIGSEYGMTAAEVKAANNFVNCEDIWEFTPICITTPKPATPTCLRTYISKPNDTCASIGAAHQMTAAEVKAANDFVNCDDIWEWTSICITTPAPTEPETREPTCAVTYQSRHGEKCSDIESKFGIPTGSVKANNNFVNCDDVWENTSICIPPSDSACTQTYKVPQKTTCAAAGSSYGVNGEVIKYWNDFIDCDDIWPGTDLCVKH